MVTEVMTTLDPRALETAAKAIRGDIWETEPNPATEQYCADLRQQAKEQAEAAITAYLSALSQPQAGEPVADWTVENVNGKQWRVTGPGGQWTMKPEGLISADEAKTICLRAVGASSSSPHPANPAQVTDAMVEAAARALYKEAGYIGWRELGNMHKNAYRDQATAALLAAIEEQAGWRLDCATEGCGKPASVHFIRGGIGSYYCHACYLKVQALPTSPKQETK